MFFKNRAESGKKLAEALQKYKGKDIVVYALPRGGVVVGAEIARELKTPLDLVIVRKIGHPYSAEYAIGAVAENGHTFLNPKETFYTNHNWLKEKIKEGQKEALRRHQTYLKNKKPIDVEGKIVILVDDGVATGLTISAAIQEIKHKKPAKIIVAVPIIAPDVAEKIRSNVDELIALDIPEDFVGSIGAYYQDFPQISDEKVITILKKFNHQQT